MIELIAMLVKIITIYKQKATEVLFIRCHKYNFSLVRFVYIFLVYCFGIDALEIIMFTYMRLICVFVEMNCGKINIVDASFVKLYARAPLTLSTIVDIFFLFFSFHRFFISVVIRILFLTLEVHSCYNCFCSPFVIESEKKLANGYHKGYRNRRFFLSIECYESII